MRIIATLGLLGSTAAAAAPVEVTDASGTLTVHPDFASAVAAAPADATLVLTEGEHGDLTVEGGVHVFVEAADGASIDSITIGGAGTVAEFQGLSMRGSDQGIEVKGGTLVLTDSELREMGSPDGYAVRVATGASLGLVNVDVSDSKGAAGAIHAESGSSVGIVGSRFFANTGASGGAISADGAEVAIANSEFRHNSASDAGGAIAMVQGTLDLMDVEFIESDASRGGAIFVGPDATLTAEDVTFRGNAAATGGHMLVDHGTASLTRVRLESGRAQHGGAVALLDSDVTVRNAMVAANEAPMSGGAFFLDGGQLGLTYITMYGNRSGMGAALAAMTGKAQMAASIVAGNEGPTFDNVSADVGLSSTLVEGLAHGAGVIGTVSLEPSVLDGNPGFLDGPGHDFALTLDSSVLDAGFEGEADPDGTPADWGMYGGDDAQELYDLDGDGFVHGRDCDENDREVHEMAKDAWYDGIDSDCDGADDFDQDGDGEQALQFGGTDCDDTNAGIHTEAGEKAGDKIDADCDGLADPDADGDGWPQGVDCDDADASTHPGATDRFYDGRDSDCDGRSDFDADGDGYDSARHGGTDCDDSDAFVSPATAEIAGDGIDQDCDGEDATPAREREAQSVTGETEGETATEASAFETAPARASTTTGCASTGATPVGGLLGVLAALAAMTGRRRND